MAFILVMMANVWGMQVYVHYANGTWPTDIADYHFNSSSGNLIIEIESSGSIGEVKDKIADKSGFEAANITLSFGTYADLDDSYTLAYYNITSESTINMTYADPTQPQRVTDNNWHVQTMPRGNRVLRTIWKQDPQLTWKVGEETVTVESNPLVAYLGFPFEGATLTAAYNDILGEVTYSIAHRTGTNSGNTVSADGVVTINGVGIDTVKAVFAGNDTLMPDSAMYIIDTRAPYTLTLATNDAAMGTVKIDSAGVISFLDSVSVKDAAANEYYVLPGAKVAVKAIPAAGYQLLKWEDNSTDLTRTVTVTGDTTLTATFGLPNPGLTPEGELTTSGTRFLDEHGDIVGTPRLTETGEFIEAGGTPDPSYGYDTEKGLYYITVSQGSSALSGGRTFYYSQGQTYSEAAANEANKVSEDIGWFVWSNDYNQATIYYKDGNGQGDMNVDGNVNFLQGDVRLNTVIDPVNHVFTFTPPY